MGNSSMHDRDSSRQVEDARLQALFAEGAAIHVVSLLFLPVLAWRIKVALPDAKILGWSVLVLLLLLARLLGTGLFARYYRSGDNPRPWRIAQLLNGVALGCAYGRLALGFAGATPQQHLMLLMVCVCVTAVVLVALMRDFATFMATCIPILVCIAIGAAGLPDPYRTNLGLILLVLTILMPYMAWHTSLTFGQQVRDRHQLNLARLLAEESAQVKSRFIANISHEIRTPINGMLGMAQLLRDLQLPGPAADHVRAILDSGKRLMGVVNDILDFSKADAGLLPMQPEVVQVRP